MVSLDMIDINKRVKVGNISDKYSLKGRLLDIGIIPGIEVEKVLVSPFKGISAYLVMDALIAVRDSDAKYVEVFYE